MLGCEFGLDDARSSDTAAREGLLLSAGGSAKGPWSCLGDVLTMVIPLDPGLLTLSVSDRVDIVEDAFDLISIVLALPLPTLII